MRRWLTRWHNWRWRRRHPGAPFDWEVQCPEFALPKAGHVELVEEPRLWTVSGLLDCHGPTDGGGSTGRAVTGQAS